MQNYFTSTANEEVLNIFFKYSSRPNNPISAESSNFVVFRLQPVLFYLYKNICCGYSFELSRVDRFLEGTWCAEKLV